MSTQDDALWRDKPIASPGEDSLGREGFVRTAVEVITGSWSPDESTVIGLLGPWGSGKTSLINLIEKELTDGPGDWRIAHFTPWSAGDSAGVMAEFYAAIATALPREGTKKFREAASELMGLAAPLANLVPYGGGVVQGAVNRAADMLVKPKSWSVVFGEASAELSKQEIRLLVVVDDVDRLQGSELAEVLKVVRLLGRFPGVQYLLSYDERSVQEALAATALVKDVKAASLFMEKIVQHPLRVPAIGVRARMNLLRREIDQAVKPWEDVEGELYMSRVGPRLPDMARTADTLRTISRFGASLRMEFTRHSPGEVDAEDLILLTYLSVREPLLFRELPHFSAELISGRQGEFTYKGMSAQRDAFDYKKVFDPVVGSRLDGAIDAMLTTLFPALKSNRVDPSGPRIGSADYFDRYFTGGIGMGDVGDWEVAAAFEELKRGEVAAIQRLIAAEGDWDDDWALLVFSKFPLPGSVSGMRSVRLVTSLCELLSVIPEEGHGFQSAHDWLRLYVEKIIEVSLGEWGEGDVARATKPAPLRDRLNLAYRLEELVTRSGQAAERWLEGWARELAAETTDFALSHLRLRDDAPVNQSIWWDFVVKHGDAESLKAQLGDALGRSDFTVEDLAARFVRVVYLRGARCTRLEEVDRFSWERLAPDEVAPWCARWEVPPVPGPAIDYPNTWPSRREFARGRLDAPLGVGNESSPED